MVGCIILPLPVRGLCGRCVVFGWVCVLWLSLVPAGGFVVVLRVPAEGCYLIELGTNRLRPVSRYGMPIPVLIVYWNGCSCII